MRMARAMVLPLLVVAGWGLAQPATQPQTDGVARGLKRIAASQPETFRFAVLGDSQFRDDAGFRAVVRQVQATDPRFVLQVGDLIPADEARDADDILRQWAYFQDQTSTLKAPLFGVPGNHDLGRTGAKEAWAKVWGPLYYSFDYAGCRFIVLNCVNTIDKVGLLGREQTQWLKQRLTEGKPQHIFVFLHYPLWHMSAKAWEPYHDLLRQAKVRAVFGGHEHWYRYEPRDGIDYITTVTFDTGGGEFETGWFGHFIDAHVDDKGVKFEVVRGDKRMGLGFLSPPVQDAHMRTWADLSATTAPEKRERATMTLRNPTDKPIRMKYRWQCDGSLAIAPASGEVSLAGDADADVAFEVSARAAEPTAFPVLNLEFDVPTAAAATAHKQITLPLRANLELLRRSARLPSKVVLMQMGQRSSGLKWFCEQIGLEPGRTVVTAGSAAELERLWPTLPADAVLISEHWALEDDDAFADWLAKNEAKLRAFVQGGGRVMLLAGAQASSGRLLDTLDVPRVPMAGGWLNNTDADVALMRLDPAAKWLTAGLIGGEVELDTSILLHGHLAPRQVADWTVLGRDSRDRAVLVATRRGKGELMVSTAQLASPYHIRDNYNQQRLWFNLLTRTVR